MYKLEQGCPFGEPSHYHSEVACVADASHLESVNAELWKVNVAASASSSLRTEIINPIQCMDSFRRQEV